MFKIQIKSIFGSVLFEYEKENNTLKDTIEEAIKSSADLRYANLRYANLSYADLRSTDLRSADLRSANLRYADLRSANLSSANLSSANLSYANLSYADLSSADLSYADPSSANLSSANLRSADLRSANLRSADLRSANLRSADLSSTDLSYADLRSADLSSAIDIDYCIAQTRILPDGDIIGYKKCVEGIVKILIPSDAKRSHAFGRKCRAEYAIVLELPEGINVAHSSYDESFIYVKGETVKPVDPFSENWTEECESGIHFFITKIEAERY